jgi:PmbA protein
VSRDVERELAGIAADVVERARRTGADAAEAVAREGSELQVRVRLGEPELVQEASSRALGLRVFVDERAATAYTSDFSPAGIERFLRDAIEAARLSEPDPLHTLPEPEELARPDALPSLDLWDDAALGVDAGLALERARRAEAAALGFDPRITGSDGASYSRVAGATAFANSAGFCAAYRGTYSSLVVEPICDDAGGKKRNGYWWTAARHLGALEEPEAVGLEAARRTVAKLGSRKPETCEVPVVFDPDAARALVDLLANVVSGGAIWRRSSYLVDREGTEVASPLVTLVDDPLIPRAPGSRPFDGDGLPTRRNRVVDAGTLRTFLCDVYSARKLSRRSTGSASRAVGSSPHPATSNFILQAGSTPAAEIVRSTERGFYVTSMIGFGFNPVTGDFSRGAEGFWIEKGELAYPVSEATLSAHFDLLWKSVDAVGDDLKLRTSTASPTLRVARMTVGGR